MIEIIGNFSPLEIDLEEDLYGYFSLGTIHMSKEDYSNCTTVFLSTSGYKCKCKIDDGNEFTVFIFRIGISDSYLVFSDFSKIPDIAVINNKEVLSEIKGFLMNNNKKTPSYELNLSDISSPWILPCCYSPNTSYI